MLRYHRSQILPIHPILPICPNFQFQQPPFCLPSMWVLCAFFETAITTTKPASCLFYTKPIENQSSNPKQPIRPIPPIRPIKPISCSACCRATATPCLVCCNFIAAKKSPCPGHQSRPALSNTPKKLHFYPTENQLPKNNFAFFSFYDGSFRTFLRLI